MLILGTMWLIGFCCYLRYDALDQEKKQERRRQEEQAKLHDLQERERHRREKM